MRQVGSWQRARWWRAGLSLIGISVAAGVAMQAVTGQWFPPPISMSQYGIGPWGWLFSVFVVSLGGSLLCFERARSRRGRLARVLYRIGMVGTLVMATVRTDAGGAQVSWNATVHMIGSIICLLFLPLGMFDMLWRLGWRWVGSVLLTALAVAMTLLLLAAAGHDTAGRGSNASWAFWQSVGVIVCVSMALSVAVAVGRRLDRSMSDHTSSRDRTGARAS